MEYTARQAVESKAFRGIVLTLWVVISMIILLMMSVRLILRGTLIDSIFGVVASLFSIVPIFVYYDLKD